MSAPTDNISNEDVERKIRQLKMSIENKNFTFEALFRLFEKLGTTLELDKIIRLFMMTLVGQLSLSQISFYLYSRKTRRLEIYHSLGLGRETILDSIEIETDFVRWLLTEKYPARINRFQAIPDEIDSNSVAIRNLLVQNMYSYAYPLMDGTALLAMIVFSEKINGEQLTDFNIEILHMIVSFASMTIKNATLYQQTLRSKIKLENFSKMKMEFMHHTSHELRTPLTVLKSAMSSMEPGNDNDAILVNISRKAVDRLQGLVEQILFLNSVELDESFFMFQKTDVVLLLEKYFRDIIPMLGKKGITVKLNKCENPGQILVDTVKLKTVLDRIIDNALSSVETGGTIYLSTSFNQNPPGEADGVEIKTSEVLSDFAGFFQERDDSLSSAEEPCSKTRNKRLEQDIDGYFVIRIGDNGVGIPTNEIKSLGEPFTRASNSKLSEVKGLGLGLSVSQKIIAGHGGYLLCRSSQGEGAEFSIWLPVTN